MQNLYKTIGVVLLLIYCRSTWAEENTPVTPQQNIGDYRSLHTKADYDKCLEKLKEYVANVAKPEYYEKQKIVHIETKKEISIKDLPEIQRYFIYLIQVEDATNLLDDVQKTWEKKKNDMAPPPAHVPRRAAPAPAPPVPADKPSKADMEKYVVEIFELRKQHAAQFEKMLDEMAQKFKDDIPADEWKKYLDRVKAYHDDNKLIARTKKNAA